jgi:hypothetical protein
MTRAYTATHVPIATWCADLPPVVLLCSAALTHFCCFKLSFLALVDAQSTLHSSALSILKVSTVGLSLRLFSVATACLAAAVLAYTKPFVANRSWPVAQCKSCSSSNKAQYSSEHQLSMWPVIGIATVRTLIRQAAQLRFRQAQLTLQHNTLKHAESTATQC